ncbi:uncharacterized protein B0T23DRAFT_183935 [Neurospora hispaniola]|uniref:Uncharacterized protein n=1 Tax=Neurospora hispaniola TaxID=588809 RepID=A0AAJ0I386_9PEZI|nr:hypothetical protein B0T23DRAFT_183935 [Neurospora hispaniola]
MLVSLFHLIHFTQTLSSPRFPFPFPSSFLPLIYYSYNHLNLVLPQSPQPFAFAHVNILASGGDLGGTVGTFVLWFWLATHFEELCGLQILGCLF